MAGGLSHNILAASVYPLCEFYDHYISGPAVKSLTGNNIACVQIFNDLQEFSKVLNSMQSIVCDSCSGWGHNATDFRRGKPNERRYCPTGEIIDTVVKFGLNDKKGYVAFQNIKRGKKTLEERMPLVLPEQKTD